MADKQFLDRLSKELVDKGQLIEAGFVSMRAACMDPKSPPDQVREMRMAFFGGAQHLFGSIMKILEPGEEPTDNDMKRLDLIDAELKKYIAEFSRDHLPTKGNA